MAQQQTLFSFFKKKNETPSAPAPPPPTKKPQQTKTSTKGNNDKKLNAIVTDTATETLAIADPMVIDNTTPAIKEHDNQMEASDNDDLSPMFTKSRRARKRTNYAISDSDENDVDDSILNSPCAPDRNKKNVKRKRLFQKKMAESDDDDYVDAPVSDIEFDEDPLAVEDESDKNTTPETPTKLTPLRERFQSISVNSPPPKKTTQSFFSNSSTRDVQRKEHGKQFKEKNENRYSWLAKPRDADQNTPDSPEYDPRTLYIPPSAWNTFTPFERQYWEVKCKQWDTILFFKKGKFYELYEKDADVGHKDFDLKMTDRVNMRMVGVPEMTFDFWAAQFIARGFKVAKADQMETAIGKSMRERNDTGKKVAKVIERKLTSVFTAGTLVDSGMLTSEMSTYCMSIKEYCPSITSKPEFGICFVDTATAEFQLTSFTDDVGRSKLETIIVQLKPRELVLEKGCVSQATLRVLKNTLMDPLWNFLPPEKEFWSDEKTLDEIRITGYFGDDVEDESSWPHALKEIRDQKITLSALGGLISYLRQLMLDKDLLSAKNISIYDPIRQTTSLVLDGQTLANLEVLQNSDDGSIDGTLIQLLGNAVTPFGKRLFKRWLCHPLRNVADINDRLDAVEDLNEHMDIHESLSRQLVGIPDLERLISRIHAKRCQVKEFLAALEGFEKIMTIIGELKSSQDRLSSKLLKSIINKFPDIDTKLNFFRHGFVEATVEIDYQKMKVIIPKSGVNQEYDDLHEQIRQAEKRFDSHLLQKKKELKCSELKYHNSGKEIYQIEVPKKVKVPKEWSQMSTILKATRYYNGELQQMVQNYKELLETKTAFIKNFTNQVYGQFDEHYELWLSATQCIAYIDALMSLAKGSAKLGGPSCRPELVEQEEGILEFRDLRHPCMIPGAGQDFIPNDTVLGGEEPSILVLTGPNMGGKSTLLRQSCIAIIMAQLGSYVPASYCRLTPCDQIFTRIGANDNILRGESTFMVELQETSKILHEATPRSMVILDELGRGTSTFDGYAIAYSVLHYLSIHVGCLAMFSTHYQTLCQEFERNPTIKNMHMGYFMDEEEHRITFLYKLIPGICGKSFGMNVAAMAGVPDSIVKKAAAVADEFERTNRLQDTSYKMDLDQPQMNLTPAVIADASYLLNDPNPNPKVLRRIIQGLSKISN
ncbi:muts domain V-domain-containing protein [Phascolomyces articulosus]|uniref:DNA mismatch repair protein n=1 Tax=Phascolomyces articulosus TaxID=60185 RepID=A0AAD5PKX4_9FUNG|nr:muts domain V-domain-containing protein [Phascolomyces articulosus]